MRLHTLLLLFISGLNPNLGYAGTLMGDWYQEETENDPNIERRAFSQPMSQSTEANQVTLGIKSPGLVDPVDFFVIVSSNSTNPGCEYTVNDIAIDAETFSVSSSAHSSDISRITALGKDTQRRLWSAFRQGQNLSLSIHQACKDESLPDNAVFTHVFSLKGSSAAYRFVSGEEAIRKPTQSTVKTEKPVSTSVPEDVGLISEDESSNAVFMPWLVGLIIVLLVAKFVKRQVIPPSTDSTFDPVGKRLKPKSGEYSRLGRATDSVRKEPQLTPETRGRPVSDRGQTIANLPRYKVERVIDGDTVIVSSFRQKLTVRLSSIDCPEDGQEWGNIATAGLIKMIGGQHVHVEIHDSDHYERTIATLYVFGARDSKWTNVNERMVTLGHAWVMRKYYDHLPKQRQNQLNKLERWAKSKRVGLWKSPDPIPPWNWRRNGSNGI